MSEIVQERLTATQRSKIRRLSAPKEIGEDEAGGELNIVPFLDIVTNVLMFVLATVSVTFTATIESSPPRAAGAGAARGPIPPSLSLTVLIVPEGFSVKTASGSIGTGCTGLGAGVTIPMINGQYDAAGLTKCADRLKQEAPAFKDEDQVIISASPQIAYQNLITAIDALRSNDKGDKLFTEVRFGVAR